MGGPFLLLMTGYAKIESASGTGAGAEGVK